MPDNAWPIAAIAGALTVGLLAILGYLVTVLGLARLRNIDEAVSNVVRQLRLRQDATIADVRAETERAKAELSTFVDKELSTLTARRDELEQLSASLAWAKEATRGGADVQIPATVHEAYLLAKAA
ncbi:MAG: hypothetical protein WD830_08150 [Chloroflexota bacterium]